jgi:hypothetical protein
LYIYPSAPNADHLQRSKFLEAVLSRKLDGWALFGFGRNTWPWGLPQIWSRHCPLRRLFDQKFDAFVMMQKPLESLKTTRSKAYYQGFILADLNKTGFYISISIERYRLCSDIEDIIVI